jgi:hypothetical protein
MLASITNAIVETSGVEGVEEPMSKVDPEAARDALLFAIAALAETSSTVTTGKQVRDYGTRSGKGLVGVVEGLRAQVARTGVLRWGNGAIVE